MERVDKYKSIKRIDNRQGYTCTGCAGSFSDKACEDLKKLMDESGEHYPSCVGSDGVIYVEVKSE